MAIDIAGLKAAAAGSGDDKVAWYADQLKTGMTDAQIRDAVNEALGTKYSGDEADWNYLQDKAAEKVIKDVSTGSAKDKAIAYNALYQGAGLTNDEIQQNIQEVLGKQDPDQMRALLGMAGARRAAQLPTGEAKADYVKQMVAAGYKPEEIQNYINTAVGQQTPGDMAELFRLAGVKLPATGSATTTWTSPTGITVQVPAGWENFTGQQKVDWFKSKNMTGSTLQALGVPATDIAGAIKLGLPSGASAGDFTTAIRYGDGMTADRTGKGVAIGGESGLRSGYAPYVQRMLERASAEADVPFQKYTGESPLLESARAGIANLTTPAQFLQGSNLAQAAGIGALDYGKYQPTSFTTGTFANPNFNTASGAGIDIARLKEMGAFTDAQAKADFYKNYMASADQALRGAADQYIGKQSGSDWNALQNLAGFNFAQPVFNTFSQGKAAGGILSLTKKYDAGGEINGNASVLNNPAGGASALPPTDPNLQPVNYGGQNVTNVQASYMSPYMQNVVDTQQREAKRQSDIAGQYLGAKATQAGAFGGSRYGLVEAENQRNLMRQLGDIEAKGLQEAYTSGLGQFNTEQQRALEAQKMSEQSRQFGAELGLRGLQTGIQAGSVLGNLGQQQGQFDLAALKQMADLGKEQRDFDYQEFLRSEKYPYENLTFMRNMLTGLPISAAATGIDPMSQALTGGISAAYLASLLGALGNKPPGG